MGGKVSSAFKPPFNAITACRVRGILSFSTRLMVTTLTESPPIHLEIILLENGMDNSLNSEVS